MQEDGGQDFVKCGSVTLQGDVRYRWNVVQMLEGELKAT